MMSPRLLEVVRCPECAGALSARDTILTCAACGRTFDSSAGYADLRPAAAYAEQTKYLDAALHTDARHETVAPPLLGSKIRNDMLRAFLQLQPGERALDLGCGSGRTMIWNADTGARMTGIDISPFFSREALEGCDLALGDLRRLPLKDESFQKAWALDVLEHLSPQALRDVLRDAGRVLAPDGTMFLYTHVRKNGPLGTGVRWVNRFAHLCERLHLIDLRQERLRKSDHLNPIADHDELVRVLAECGFRLERITYYTPIAGAFVENVIIRIAERFLTRKASRAPGMDEGAASRAARSAAKTRLRRGGATYMALRGLTALMMLDVRLFGRFKSGPFFALVKKTGAPGPA